MDPKPFISKTGIGRCNNDCPAYGTDPECKGRCAIDSTVIISADRRICEPWCLNLLDKYHALLEKDGDGAI